MNEMKPLLETRDLAIGYKTDKKVRTISSDLNLNLLPGQLVCLLGPNGAGKSTLMRTLAGLQPALSGQVTIEENLLSELSPGDLARKLSLVLTEKIEAGNLTVNEVVTLGRTPYTDWLGTLTSFDKEKISHALKATDTFDYKHRRIHQLSDGERQKVMLARALAQDTNLILLDEPTAHLDLPSRVEMMHLLHTLARQTNKAILLSTHELDLALQASDQLWLMKLNGEMTTGLPEDLVLNGAFESTFAKTGFYFDRKSGTFTIHKEAVSFNIQVFGNPELIFWTKRALQREGIGTDTNDSLAPKITTSENAGLIRWQLEWFGSSSAFTELGTLMDVLRVKIAQNLD